MSEVYDGRVVCQRSTRRDIAIIIASSVIRWWENQKGRCGAMLPRTFLQAIDYLPTEWLPEPERERALGAGPALREAGLTPAER